jgi:Amt family ammonium transporter
LALTHHHVHPPRQLLGTLILWFGWYGFNSGSALLADGTGKGDILAMYAAANTTLSAGAAGLSSVFVNYLVQQRLTGGQGQYDLRLTMNGVLSGLVAVTASCALIEPWAAVTIGSCAGALYLFASWGLVRLRLDDAVDAIPIHMINGIWGMLATGIFASPKRLQQAYGRHVHAGLLYSGQKEGSSGGVDMTLLGAQIVGVLFIIGWTSGVMLPFFVGLEKMGRFRADAMAEVAGLDKASFGGLQHDGGEDEITPEQIQTVSKQLDRQLRHRVKRSYHRSSCGSNTSGSKTASEKETVDLSVITTDIGTGDDSKIAKTV